MPSDLARQPAGVGRRLGAILYDTVMVMGVLLLTGVLVVPFMGDRLLVPAESGLIAYALRCVQLLLIGLFFGYFWVRRGQTIGMLAWRLQITAATGQAPRWMQCLQRLVVLWILMLPYFVGDWLWFSHWPPRWRSIAWYVSWMPLAACYAWIWIDREHRAWHDRLSGTRIWVLPKRR